MNCPTDGATLEPIHEEVDIGVGTQRFLSYYECPECGPRAVCPTCKALSGTPCEDWCESIAKLDEMRREQESDFYSRPYDKEVLN